LRRVQWDFLPQRPVGDLHDVVIFLADPQDAERVLEGFVPRHHMRVVPQPVVVEVQCTCLHQPLGLGYIKRKNDEQKRDFEEEARNEGERTRGAKRKI